MLVKDNTLQETAKTSRVHDLGIRKKITYKGFLRVTKLINIHFVDAPHITASGITLATRGASVRLECTVDAFPEPKMLFWRDPVGRIPVIQSGHYDLKVLASKEVSIWQ